MLQDIDFAPLGYLHEKVSLNKDIDDLDRASLSLFAGQILERKWRPTRIVGQVLADLKSVAN